MQNASKVVALLLSHRASTDLLWSGHSPLSLAIASGNDLVDQTHTPTHSHQLTHRYMFHRNTKPHFVLNWSSSLPRQWRSC